MDIKKFIQKARESLTSFFKSGFLSKSFRITYDVVWNLILFFLVIGLFGAVFLGAIGAGYFASLVKDEPIRSYASMERDIYNYEETSKLYFANNIYFGDIRSDIHREEISLDQISPTLIDAVIATEDESFFDHNGVVPRAIVRALVQEVVDLGSKTGGSTLTQQLIKNQILTNEVSFDRKAKEILLAMRLEKFFDKEQILEAYLNVIPYGRNSSGRNIAGIQTASLGIFGLDAKDLNLAQAAYLAGLPQSPSYYTPFVPTGGLKSEEGIAPSLNRMRVVLNRMLEAGFITESDYNEALSYDIVGDFIEPVSSPRERYGYLTAELEERAKDIIKIHLIEEDGYSLEDLSNDETLRERYETLADRALRMNGYHIHSTIDKEIYDVMQEVVKEFNYAERDIINDEGESESVQASGMIIENNTGRIISFVGGREYTNENEYNYATKANRSFGSTIKPILIYAPAMEEGLIQPGTPLVDIKTEIPNPGGKPWVPRNYDSTYFYGTNSARVALANSYNVTAARLYNGFETDDKLFSIGREYMKKMGITTILDHEYDYPAQSLGSSDTIVEQNTNAFSVFGNNGKFNRAFMIDKITTSDGEVIYEHESEEVEVFSPQTTYLTVDMLRDVISEGTATAFKSFVKNQSVDWAGKTGTSNDHKDAWFIGFNPNITFGAWLGFDTPYDLSKACQGCSLNHTGRLVKLWGDIINNISEINPELVTPTEGFKRPDGIVERRYCAISGMLPSDLCEELGLIQSDLFNIEFVPTEIDDSLLSGSYTLIDGKAYIAHPNTPKEFVQDDGYMFNPEFLKRRGFDDLEDITQIYPLRNNRSAWEKISAASADKSLEAIDLKDEGSFPGAPRRVKYNDEIIVWEKPDHDYIVGYRIYEAVKEGDKFKQVDHTVKTEYSKFRNNAAYYITAVDYFGRESEGSDFIIIGEIESIDEDEDDKDKKKDKDKDKDKDPDEDTDDNNDENSRDNSANN